MTKYKKKLNLIPSHVFTFTKRMTKTVLTALPDERNELSSSTQLPKSLTLKRYLLRR